MIKGVLFQESLHAEPFWMLVACQLVNRTKWEQAEPVFERLRKKYANPVELASADHEQLSELIRTLGFQNRRAKSLVAMATEYMIRQPRTAGQVGKMPGCGQYARDSWSIFVEDQLFIVPSDVELAGYLVKVKRGEKLHKNVSLEKLT